MNHSPAEIKRIASSILRSDDPLEVVDHHQAAGDLTMEDAYSLIKLLVKRVLRSESRNFHLKKEVFGTSSEAAQLSLRGMPGEGDSPFDGRIIHTNVPGVPDVRYDAATARFVAVDEQGDKILNECKKDEKNARKTLKRVNRLMKSLDTSVNDEIRKAKPAGYQTMMTDGERFPVIEVPWEGSRPDCACCGQPMKIHKYKTDKRLVFLPPQFLMVETKVPVFMCGHGCVDINDHSVLVPGYMPPRLFEKGPATPGVIAELACSLIEGRDPLNNQQEIYARRGRKLAKQTISEWLCHCFETYLSPVIQLIEERFRTQSVVHLDGTPFVVCEDKSERQKSYILGYRSGKYEEHQITGYMYAGKRNKDAILTLLGRCFDGAIMCDGNASYPQAAELIRGAVLLVCLVHIRRYFLQAEEVRSDYKEYLKFLKKRPGRDDRAEFLLDHLPLLHLEHVKALFSDLYAVESKLNDEQAGPETVKKVRNACSRPLLDELCEEVAVIEQEFDMSGPVGKAVHYFNDRKEQMYLILQDGAYPLDNNREETSIRALDMVRKNVMFSNTRRGCRSLLGYMTFIQTAISNQADPQALLAYTLEKLAGCRVPVTMFKDDSQFIRGQGDYAFPRKEVEKLLPFSDRIPEECRCGHQQLLDKGWEKIIRSWLEQGVEPTIQAQIIRA